MNVNGKEINRPHRGHAWEAQRYRDWADGQAGALKLLHVVQLDPIWR